jgi:parvulin-like peptidyl-prolyl isomerase
VAYGDLSTDLNAAAFSLEEGEFTRKPIEDEHAVYLLKVESRQAAAKEDFNDPKVQEAIKTMLNQQRRKDWEQRYLARVQDTAPDPATAGAQFIAGRLLRLEEEQVNDPVEEEAIDRYYAGNKESFRETSVHLFTIAFELGLTEEERTKQRKEAQALRDEIANGKPFAEVAREHSEDPYASDGGDNMTVKRGERTEPLNSAIFALKPGVPDLHDDGSFLRILKVEDRVEGEIAPLADVREQIAEILLQQQRDELLRQWQEKARVNVDAWEKEHKPAAKAAVEKEKPQTQVDE